LFVLLGAGEHFYVVVVRTVFEEEELLSYFGLTVQGVGMGILFVGGALRWSIPKLIEITCHGVEELTLTVLRVGLRDRLLLLRVSYLKGLLLIIHRDGALNLLQFLLVYINLDHLYLVGQRVHGL
jgi:hypothetical protein